MAVNPHEPTQPSLGLADSRPTPQETELSEAGKGPHFPQSRGSLACREKDKGGSWRRTGERSPPLPPESPGPQGAATHELRKRPTFSGGTSPSKSGLELSFVLHNPKPHQTVLLPLYDLVFINIT